MNRHIALAIFLSILFFGAGCRAPEPSPTSDALSASQVVTNSTFEYTFRAPEQGQVSTPVNFTAGAAFSQQKVWISFPNGSSATIDVYFKDKADIADETRLATDPAFQKVSIGDKTAWQSKIDDAGSGLSIIKTVFVGSRYVYVIEYSATSPSDADQAALDALLESFTHE